MFKETFWHFFRGRNGRDEEKDCALVLSGGGARSAYQVGVLSYIADAFSDFRFPILNGVSAGAINAAHVANHGGTPQEAADSLVDMWLSLSTEDVYRAESGVRVLWNFLRHGFRAENEEDVLEGDVARALLNTDPLRALLEEALAADGRLQGIETNLQKWLKAFSVVTTNYATGQTVTWVQGREATHWERPNRISVNTTLTLDHIMASTALPLLFPAIRIGDAWYGDGGIRLAAPLAPAIHLGADRILIVSTRYDRTREEANRPSIVGYPPPAQILSILMSSIFLDMLDQDAQMLRRLNKLIEALPEDERNGMRPIQLMQIHPSLDLGRLAGDYEATLPATFRFLARGIGTEETESPDWLSMLLFEPDFINRLVEVGYHDARRLHDDIEAFLAGEKDRAYPQ